MRQSFKVNLTKEEKRQIGKPSIPRPEIDLLALHFARNEVLAFEANSFLDSPSVRLANLRECHDVPEGRYKLFTCEPYRTIVFTRLLADLVSCGMAGPQAKVSFGLAAGRVYQGPCNAIREFLNQKNWLFWSPQDVKSKVTALAKQDYENDATIITAKILLR